MNCIRPILLQLSIIFVLHRQAVTDDIHWPHNLTRYHAEEQVPFGPNERFHDCERKLSGGVPHETQAPHGAQTDPVLPIVEVTPFVVNFKTEEDEPNKGHIAFVNNPARTVSVLEPLTEGGCELRTKASVMDMALKNKCLLAVNAGFFNSATRGCLGNVVAGGRLVLNSHGIQNAHFGIREDGTLFFGYLTEEDVLDQANPFISLVGGVGWIIRDGEVYVDESLEADCGDTQETGTIDVFFGDISARMVIGSDREGRVVIAHVDGKTFIEGISLRQFAVWLLKQGVVNAVNLDGGGSSTFVVNGTVANYPADIRKGSNNTDLRYTRGVSTVVCVHEPKCVPGDCPGHGECILGNCRCDGDWDEPDCSTLSTTLQQKSNRCDGFGDHLHGRYDSCAKDCLGDQCSCHHLAGTNTNEVNASSRIPPEPAGLYTLLRDIVCRRLLEYVLQESNTAVLVLGAISLVSVVLNVSLLCNQRSFKSKNNNT